MTQVHYPGEEPVGLTEFGILLTPGMPDFDLDPALVARLPATLLTLVEAPSADAALPLPLSAPEEPLVRALGESPGETPEQAAPPSAPGE